MLLVSGVASVLKKAPERQGEVAMVPDRCGCCAANGSAVTHQSDETKWSDQKRAGNIPSGNLT